MKAALLVLVLLAVAGVSHADPADDETSRFVMQAGVGGRYWRDLSRPDPNQNLTSASGEAGAVQVMGGVRLYDGLSLGIRLVGAWERYTLQSFGMQSTDTSIYTVVPFDLAGTLLFEIDIFWVSPWVGWHTQRTQVSETHCRGGAGTCEQRPDLSIDGHWNTGGLGFGMAVGLDMIAHAHHRLGMFIEGQGSSRDYFAIGLGISYRRR